MYQDQQLQPLEGQEQEEEHNQIAMTEPTIDLVSTAHTIGRVGLSAATTGSSIGFDLAKKGTALGFGIAKTLTHSAASVGTFIMGGEDESVQAALKSGIDAMQFLAMAGISLGENITAGSLAAADTALSAAKTFFGDEEAARALGAFIQLLRREMNEDADNMPPGGYGQYGFAERARAVVAWSALQSVTADWYESQWKNEIVELSLSTEADDSESQTPPPKRQRLTIEDIENDVDEVDEVDEPEPQDETLTISSEKQVQGNEIVEGEIGKSGDVPNASATDPEREDPAPHSASNLKEVARVHRNLKKYSKFVLGVYGGMAAMYFGIPLASQSDATTPGSTETLTTRPDLKWWDVIRGVHDAPMFERSADLEPGSVTAGSTTWKYMPRYYVIQNHREKSIVLALRGTFSINDLAIDLTCESAEFTPTADIGAGKRPYRAHSGMLEAAKRMGGIGAPVTMAVSDALRSHPDYDFVIVGHSLGAGIAAFFAAMWGDPSENVTLAQSGLPGGRRMHAWAYAPPCVFDKALSTRCRPLITSLEASWDVVSRLSLGSMQDIRVVSAWICQQTREGGAQSNILARAKAYQNGDFDNDPERKQQEYMWLLSTRKTLEANMTNVHLYPPGNIYWIIKKGDFISQADDFEYKLLRVDGDVSKVFSEIVIAKRLLSDHMPQQYAKAIQSL